MNAEIPQPRDLEPIYVDLDGTLISSDMLWESLWLLLHSRPGDLLRLPGWLLGGKAHFKEQVASRVRVAPALVHGEQQPQAEHEESQGGEQ